MEVEVSVEVEVSEEVEVSMEVVSVDGGISGWRYQ